MAGMILPRQSNESPGFTSSDDFDGDDSGSWWWSAEGMAVRYLIVALLCAAAVAFFIGGYYHAQRRQRHGLPPLAYHRWMVRRTYEPRAHYAMPYHRQQTYGIQDYPPPPPAYNRHEAPPPIYSPPEGSSKVIPNQHVTEVPPQEVREESGHTGVEIPRPAAGLR